jgi:HPt (histidine-containing phosphotransfer) domain-containing protein
MDHEPSLKQKTDIFDFATFKSRMLDEEEIVKHIISGILSRMPGMIKELREFVEQGDVDNAGRQAHKIKGAAANLGCELFRKAAFKIELAAKSEGIDRITELMSSLEVEWERLKPVLQEALL